MKLSRSFAALGGAAALTVAASAAAAAAPAAPGHRDASRVIGQVYVDDNTTVANTVAGFDRHADGSLTPLPGSPFATGGVGTGTGAASQGALQLSPDGRFLLAVDAGSNQISVLKIRNDGSLALAEHGVVASGGVTPVSIAATARDHGDDLVYVANAGTGGSSYSGFTLSSGGRLQPIAGSTIALPDGSAPSDVLFNADGTRAAGTRVGPSLIDSFTVDRAGRLHAAPGSPYAGQGLGQLGAEFRPTNANQLFVSNAHNGPGLGTVSSYRVGRDGSLTSITDGPVADDQTAPCWVEITRDGRYLFTANTAQPSISSYAVAHDGSLSLVGSTPLDTTTQKAPTDLRLAPGGHLLYQLTAGADAISAFGVDGGALTPLGVPTALPAGAAPLGIVVT